MTIIVGFFNGVLFWQQVRFIMTKTWFLIHGITMCHRIILGMVHLVAAIFVTKYSSYTTSHNCNSKREERQVLIKVLADGI